MVINLSNKTVPSLLTHLVRYLLHASSRRGYLVLFRPFARGYLSRERMFTRIVATFGKYRSTRGLFLSLAVDEFFNKGGGNFGIV